MSGHWIGQEVSHLQPGGIMLLVHEADVEVWHGPNLIATSGNTPELEFKVIILFPASLFDQYPGLAAILPLFSQRPLQALHAESPRYFVWIVGIMVLLNMKLFVDCSRNERDRRLLDDLIHTCHKAGANGLIKQDGEVRFRKDRSIWNLPWASQWQAWRLRPTRACSATSRGSSRL